jgi:hypothetical protein
MWLVVVVVVVGVVPNNCCSCCCLTFMSKRTFYTRFRSISRQEVLLNHAVHDGKKKDKVHRQQQT